MDTFNFRRKTVEEKILVHDVDHGPEVIPGQFWANPTHLEPGNVYRAPQPSQHAATEKKICGFRRSTFFLIIALVAVIVVAGVGGGVGGTLAVQNARNQAQLQVGGSPVPSATGVSTTETTTTTATETSTSQTGSPASTSEAVASASPTTSSRISVPTAGLLALDCPGLSGKTTSNTIGNQTLSYDTECGVDNNGQAIDIMTIISYSLRDCLMACSSYNANDATEKCVGVQFHADLTKVVPEFSGNCWLKKKRGTAVDDTNASNFNLHVSAMLSI